MLPGWPCTHHKHQMSPPKNIHSIRHFSLAVISILHWKSNFYLHTAHHLCNGSLKQTTTSWPKERAIKRPGRAVHLLHMWRVRSHQSTVMAKSPGKDMLQERQTVHRILHQRANQGPLVNQWSGVGWQTVLTLKSTSSWNKMHLVTAGRLTWWSLEWRQAAFGTLGLRSPPSKSLTLENTLGRNS